MANKKKGVVDCFGRLRLCAAFAMMWKREFFIKGEEK